jgi:hypothetical protein
LRSNYVNPVNHENPVTLLDRIHRIYKMCD